MNMIKTKRRAALLLAAALLSGCGGGETAQTSPASERGAAAPSAQQTAEATGSLHAAQTRESSRELTEEEVLAAYDRAVSVYEWFELNPLPSGGPVREEGGVEYRRVEYAGFHTLDDLRTYLESLFSEDLTAHLLNRDSVAPRYRDIDGALYVRPDGRAADAGKGAASAAVERGEDGSYLINVTVDLLDREQAVVTGAEFYAFPYREVGGRWVFTEFRLVY